MEMYNKFKVTVFAMAIGLFTFACSSETQNEANQEAGEAQAEVVETNAGADSDFEEYDAWISTTTARGETVTEDEYRELRSENDRRRAELEAESSTWDEDRRRRWDETKKEWEDFENSVQKRLGNIDDVDVDVDVNRDNN